MKAQDVSWEIGNRKIFSGINLSIGEGEAVELRGPNGSGKSTLLRLLANLQQPHQGRVVLTTQRVGFIGHKSGLSGLSSVMENIEWYCALAGVHCQRSDVDARLNQFGLVAEKHTRVQELSAGQSRRCALLCLSLGQHDLWLLDEPTASLDAQGIALTHDLITQHRQHSGGVILATHSADRLPQATRVDLNHSPL